VGPHIHQDDLLIPDFQFERDAILKSAQQHKSVIIRTITRMIFRSIHDAIIIHDNVAFKR